MDEQDIRDNDKGNGIHIIDLLRIIWKNRWLIIRITGAFAILGLVIALTSTKQYKAEALLLPEVNTNRGGVSMLLRQFSGLGGFPMGIGDESSDAIRPELYPSVLKSTPFYLQLLEHEIIMKSEKGVETITVLRYINEYTDSFWGNILKFPFSLLKQFRSLEKEDTLYYLINNIPKMGILQYETIEKIQNSIKSEINRENGIITISAELPDPEAAAQIADFAVDYIIKYISEYRTAKTRKDLEFLIERHAEKEKEFIQAQLKLARFNDANKNIISAAAKIEEQRLLDQYNLNLNIFTGLSQQLEQARIKVQEETPVITIFEPVMVPLEKNRPKRLILLILFTFSGFIISLSIIMGKNILHNLNNE